MRLIIDGDAARAARVDPLPLKAMARAYRWSNDLVSGLLPRALARLAVRIVQIPVTRGWNHRSREQRILRDFRAQRPPVAFSGSTAARESPHTRGFRSILRKIRKIADWMAEREGFEPSVPVTQYARLAIWCLRPLGHLSAASRKAGGS